MVTAPGVPFPAPPVATTLGCEAPEKVTSLGSVRVMQTPPAVIAAALRSWITRSGMAAEVVFGAMIVLGFEEAEPTEDTTALLVVVTKVGSSLTLYGMGPAV